MLASLAMSIKGPIAQHDPDNDIVIGFLDISRAHPHVEMKRELYTELPPEHPEYSRGKVGRRGRRHPPLRTVEKKADGPPQGEGMVFLFLLTCRFQVAVMNSF